MAKIGKRPGLVCRDMEEIEDQEAAEIEGAIDGQGI